MESVRVHEDLEYYIRTYMLYQVHRLSTRLLESFMPQTTRGRSIPPKNSLSVRCTKQSSIGLKMNHQEQKIRSRNVLPFR